MAIANGTCVSFCNQPKAHFGLPWVRPWDNRGKFHIDEKEDSMSMSNVSQHIPIYLQPFTSYSEILVGNCNFFLPTLHLTPSWVVAIGIPGKSLVLKKNHGATRQWRQFNDRLSRFDTIPVCDGQTDRQTNVQPISITCAVLLTHVKNRPEL